jgi:sigma-B regulation protein RsbU (phosphoserine phosphatase)
MRPDQTTFEMLGSQIPPIMLGSIFVFVGLTALAISAVRHRKGLRVLAWFGLFSTIYGVRLLAEARAFFAMLPPSLTSLRPYTIAVLTYVILIPAMMVWYDLSKGGIRKLINVLLVATIVVAILGISTSLLTGNTRLFSRANSLIAIVLTLLIAVVNVVPSLARRYLTIQSPVLTVGSLVLGVVALQVNLATFLPFERWGGLEPVAFGIFVLSIGYVAVERVLINDRRLLAIDKELAVARDIQNSILPAGTPQISGLRIAAAYHPMTSVAGDLYEFIKVDDRRAGFLIADVSGHGVPAALIASMIKVATYAVQSQAANPGELLRGLNRILTPQLNGQFVTAGYLFVDMEAKVASYSGAGHPPLLHWNNSTGDLQRLDSNGLLFGVLKETDYPTKELPLRSGDRFLLYTDGLTEPENNKGEEFGAQRIGQVIRGANLDAPAELSSTLVRESAAWQPPNTPQQDDVTLIFLAVD